MTSDQMARMDDDTASGMSSTILVLGRGASSVDAVRCTDSDWDLRAWAAPELASKIDAEMASGGDCWLVAIERGHEDELDRDHAVLAYGSAWRRQRP